MNDNERFNAEFKDLILECDKILVKEYELKSKTKKISYFFNCKVAEQDSIQIKLESEKGSKWIGFSCFFFLNEHQDFEFQLEAQKKKPKIEIRRCSPKKMYRFNRKRMA